jgi:hypothetical protein
MTLTELRETLSAVSDAVPVPAPDAVAFQRHVARVRRRRAAACGIGAAAAVAAVLENLPSLVSLGARWAGKAAPLNAKAAPA